MELTQAQRDALTAALHDVRADVRDRIVETATLSWNTLGSWRDADIARFVANLTPLVEAGKQTVAQATDAALAAMIDDDPVGVVDLSQIRGGVPASDVYRRPAVAMRSALAEGQSVTDALAAGTTRLKSLVATDLELAHTHQARGTLTGKGRTRRARGRVEAFRRVPSGVENCALCLIASTQRYWVGQLMPIHPGCDCGVESLGVGEHLDQVIDPALLESVHDQVQDLTGMSDRSGRAVDYRQLIVTHEHGEYGPTIAWKGQKFTGPDDVATRETIEVAPARPATTPAPDPETSWLYDAIRHDDLDDFPQEDLLDLYNEATAANDPRARALVGKVLEKRERQMAGYRGTGYTREQLRGMYAEYVDQEYRAAEEAANWFLLNEEGRRAGISPKSLFTGTEARARKYASDDLMWYWAESPRLSFDAFVGDSDAIGASGKMEF